MSGGFNREIKSCAGCINGCFSMVMAGAIGGLICGSVNAALYEISVSPGFSGVFGAALMLLAGAIVWRVCKQSDRRDTSAKLFVVCFAGLVFLAGIFCFVLDKKWVDKLAPTAKIPMYIVVGIALTFAFVFTSVDLLNFCATKGACRPAGPVVANSAQICVILLAAVALGCYFGLLFASLDVEDEGSKGVVQDRELSVPIGVSVGFVIGLLNNCFATRPTRTRSQRSAESSAVKRYDVY